MRAHLARDLIDALGEVARRFVPQRGGRSSQTYSIELLDEDGTVIWKHAITCAHDAEAIRRTGRLGHPHPMRLRHGERVVAVFPAGRAARPRS
jgi:hypothetical protein